MFVSAGDGDGDGDGDKDGCSGGTPFCARFNDDPLRTRIRTVYLSQVPRYILNRIYLSTIGAIGNGQRVL